MAISLDEAKELTGFFVENYPRLAQNLGFFFRDTAYEINPNLDNTVRGALKILAKDQWHEKAQQSLHAEVWAVLKNASSPQDFRETLNHEVLGHYCLNAVEPIRKRLVLDQIKSTQQSPEMRDLWDTTNRMYEGTPLNVRAEELYCINAERITPDLLSDKEQVHEKGSTSYRETCLYNLRSFTKEDLTNLTLWHIQQVMELNQNLQPLPGIQEYQKGMGRQSTTELIR